MVKLIVLLLLLVQLASANRTNASRRTKGRDSHHLLYFTHLSCDLDAKEAFPTAELMDGPFIMLVYKKQLFFFFEKFVLKLPGKDGVSLTLRKLHEHFQDEKENVDLYMTHNMPLVAKIQGK